MQKGKQHNQPASTGDTAQSTLSIGGAEFSIARLVLPGTDTEATVVVGEMALALDAHGRSAVTVVAVGTTVQGIDKASGARTDISVHVEPDIASETADTTLPRQRTSRARGTGLMAEHHSGTYSPDAPDGRIGRPLADVLVTPGMVDRTVAVWSPMIGREVTREEAHNIIVDMSIFLRYLLRWDQLARKSVRDNDEDLAQAA